MSVATEQVHVVRGMTCEHCRRAVSAEVGAVAGVEAVEVDLGAGTVTVRGRDVDPAAVRAAVAEAGYEAAP